MCCRQNVYRSTPLSNCTFVACIVGTLLSLSNKSSKDNPLSQYPMSKMIHFVVHILSKTQYLNCDAKHEFINNLLLATSVQGATRDKVFAF